MICVREAQIGGKENTAVANFQWFFKAFAYWLCLLFHQFCTASIAKSYTAKMALFGILTDFCGAHLLEKKVSFFFLKRRDASMISNKQYPLVRLSFYPCKISSDSVPYLAVPPTSEDQVG